MQDESTTLIHRSKSDFRILKDRIKIKSLLSNINDNIDNNKRKLKTWGNISCENFVGGNSPGGVQQMGSLMSGNFLGLISQERRKKSVKNKKIEFSLKKTFERIPEVMLLLHYHLMNRLQE